MKELSTEEKARRYDEAIALAKDSYNYPSYPGFIRADVVFPELKESDDERIRKALLNEFIHLQSKGYKFAGLEGEDIIAWLEKQGEQKFANKFHEGDYIVNDYCMGRIEEITNDAYRLDTGIEIPFSCHSTRLYDITKDAKDGDLIYVSTEEKGIQAIFDKINNGIIYFHCHLCGDFSLNGYIPMGDVKLVYPLQKTHYRRFFEKMHEAHYEWDAYDKKLKDIVTP